MEKIGQRELVALHQLSAAAIENRKTRARYGNRHAPQQDTIKRLRLRQIRNLGRTADVSDRRQHRILNHRAEEALGESDAARSISSGLVKRRLL